MFAISELSSALIAVFVFVGLFGGIALQKRREERHILKVLNRLDPALQRDLAAAGTTSRGLSELVLTSSGPGAWKVLERERITKGTGTELRLTNYGRRVARLASRTAYSWRR